jgi:hypothetical protein
MSSPPQFPVGALSMAELARRVGASCRLHGMTAPAFRAPPTDPTLDRSLRRHEGGAIVSVRIRDREYPDVARDMVEGALAANYRSDDEELRAAMLREVLDTPPEETPLPPLPLVPGDEEPF